MTDKKSIDPKDLSRLISFLDGYAALSVVDPLRIKRIVKKNPDDPDIAAVWKEVSRDVDDISSLPSSSDQVMKQSKILGILRPVIMFLGLIVFTIYFVLQGLGVMRNLGSSGVYVFLGGFLVTYLVGFGVYFTMNRKLTRLVNAYYEKHMGEIARQRRHLKVVNQRLIDKLAMIVRSRDYDPSRFKFSLFHDDYANINVVREDKNQIYTVVVKGKSVKKESV
ncbi:MAG: hypothetical protein OK439_05760 [Thaumarchaeota archaeon]|nr:hypothetical protein [Nitrososphaerota archaeon]